MAKDTVTAKGPIHLNIGGVDESTPLTSDKDTVGSNNGSFPFFNGMYQRMLGKKLIDFNPDQAVYGICQTFNGTCLYGYYVQTNNKLYYHVCAAPPDLRIKFWPNV